MYIHTFLSTGYNTHGSICLSGLEKEDSPLPIQDVVCLSEIGQLLVSVGLH